MTYEQGSLSGARRPPEADVKVSYPGCKGCRRIVLRRYVSEWLQCLTQLETTAWGVLLLFSVAACVPVPATHQEPEPQYNLQGTWRWYSSDGHPRPCFLQFWSAGGRWYGRFVQDYEMERNCRQHGYWLDRIQVDRAEMVVWLKKEFEEGEGRMRFAFVTPSRFDRRVGSGPADYFVLVSRSVLGRTGGR